MADEIKYIKRIKLSNGITYQICDVEAARAADLENYLPLEGGTITGNLYIDNVMSANNLSIISIEELELDTPDYVLIQQSNESEIKKRNVDKLLEDIGGISYSMDESSGTLSLKFGRQTN